ncbi:hypothetical protein [Devosia sp. A449]
MDSYPDHVAPLRDSGGWQSEAFLDWWDRVGKATFGAVPEDIVEHWIHEHWGGSPFGSLRSSDYTYSEVSWNGREWGQVVSSWDDFSNTRERSILKGEELALMHRKELRLCEFMVAAGKWPVHPVVLDNRGNSLPFHPENGFPLPSTFILIEGHTRFNLAAYLASVGNLVEPMTFWMMTPRGN